MRTTRVDFQRLSRLRLVEAQALLELSHFPGAYYLAGYAVECALKACIAKRFRRNELPDKNLVLAAYTHKLDDLVRIAELEPLLKVEQRQSPEFLANWSLVKDWTEESRYVVIDEGRARDMLTALSGRNGVMAWIRRHW